MIRKTISLLAIFWLASAVAGAAQGIDNGTEVRVNPVAGGPSSVLLYPGGEYMRVVPPLLQPGQRGGPIELHLPTKRAARARATAQVAKAEPDSGAGYKPGPEFGSTAPSAKSSSGYTPGADFGAPAPAPRAAPKPKPAPKMAAAQPAPQPPSSGYTPGADFGAPADGGLFHYTGPSKPAPAPKTQIARAEPAPPETSVPGLTKQSIILFAHDAADPAESALSNIKLLAQQLNAAMNGPSARVQIQAYGGPKGDKGSDARRLSLKRALAIRQVLIDDGVPAERIDVRAMGGGR